MRDRLPIAATVFRFTTWLVAHRAVTGTIGEPP
jgi:hypothetical protein